MLVRCPQCRSEFRVVEYAPDERVLNYLCPHCSEIVRIDLNLDEVQSSSSAGSFRDLERRKTVLVVDDTAATADRAVHALQEAGYNVLTAADGRQALRVIHEEHPDLVVLDLLLPVVSGFEVLREMRQDERVGRTPVLAVTGVGPQDPEELRRSIDVEGVLDRGHDPSSLVSAVQSIFEGAPS